MSEMLASRRDLARGLAALGLTAAVAPTLARAAPREQQAAAGALTPAAIDAAVKAAYERYRGLNEGKNADYIPALAKVPSNYFGIALVTPEGKVSTVGDIEPTFSIQSISKVFTMALVFQERSEQFIEDDIGVDATGQVFNSIIAIEQHRGKEMNPLVNPGAIATTGLVQGANADEIWAKIIGIHSDFAGRKLGIDEEVYKSEAATNQRNRAISMLMSAYERFPSDPAQAVDLYTRQCSIAVNAKDLGVMAATLANGCKNPVT
ncbi:MAG TPA: glutaminase, partial [Phenylobacterium sp.]|nr:glutaminase [Phenylobacterium sp.]